MKKIGYNIKHAFSLLTFNIKVLIPFVLLYTVCAGAILSGVSEALWMLAYKAAGITYLGNDTIGALLKSPVSWVILLITMALTAYVFMIEISGIICIFYFSNKKEKVKLRVVLNCAFSAARRTFNPKNLNLILVLVLLLPILGVQTISNLGYSIQIPSFIMNFIVSMKFLYALCIIVMIILLIVVIRWMFSFPIFVMEGTTFTAANKKSEKLIKGRFWKSVIILIISMLAAVVVWFLVSRAAYGITSLVCIGADASVRLHNADTAILIITLIFYFLVPAWFMSVLYMLFDNYQKEEGVTEINNEQVDQLMKPMKKRKFTFIIVICACVFVGSMIYHGSFVGNGSLILKRPEIVAHRGDSVRAPENSRAAYELAIEEGADWIECDVHQTVDGVLVMTHDDSLLRIAGVDKTVHETTYEELVSYDVGSWFSKDFADLRVMTLDELLDLCKGKIKLQIELKPTDYDNNLEQGVIDAIKAHDMTDSCVITSLNHDTLRKVKEIDSTISTVFDMLVIDSTEGIDSVDGLCVEVSAVTSQLVESAHSQGYEFYPGTLNTKDGLQTLVDAGVDGILTDDPVMLKEALDQADYIGGFGVILRNMVGY